MIAASHDHWTPSGNLAQRLNAIGADLADPGECKARLAHHGFQPEFVELHLSEAIDKAQNWRKAADARQGSSVTTALCVAAAVLLIAAKMSPAAAAENPFVASTEGFVAAISGVALVSFLVGYVAGAVLDHRRRDAPPEFRGEHG